jgi:hypothetical protein
MSRFIIPGSIKLFSVTFLFLIFSFLTIGAFTGFCSEKEVSTLEAVEVKDGAEEAPADIPLAEVIQVREVTRVRLYGLIALWAGIALCVYLINLQRKDDEKLYQEGYYNREDE